MNWLAVLLQYVAPLKLLSRLAGIVADSSLIRVPLIRLFVRIYDVDLGESERELPREFHHFNDFFTRRLKSGARSVAHGAGTVISPVDGTVSEIGAIEDGAIVQAKGIEYTVDSLLDGDDAAAFQRGSFVTLYLSPRDYHRVHAPLDMEVVSARYIPGKLFSVNPGTVARIPRLFARNERLVARGTSGAGRVCLIMVGAVIVAGIKPIWRPAAYPPGRSGLERFDPPAQLAGGDEFGQFQLGSTVILLFEEGRIAWSPALRAGSPVRMGEPLGTVTEAVS